MRIVLSWVKPHQLACEHHSGNNALEGLWVCLCVLDEYGMHSFRVMYNDPFALGNVAGERHDDT